MQRSSPPALARASRPLLTVDEASHLLEDAGLFDWSEEVPRALAAFLSAEAARGPSAPSGFRARALARATKARVDAARATLDVEAAATDGELHERLSVMAACVVAGVAHHAAGARADAAALVCAVRDLF